jgi:hypothetical protein
MSDRSRAIKLFEQLRAESAHLSEKGFVSPDFQKWHAAAIEALRANLGEQHNLYQDFAKLQFEWAPEVLAKFAQTFESNTSTPFPFEIEQARRFDRALTEAREILTTAIVSLRSK